MNKKEISHLVTNDGSSTLRSATHNALYHSSFGAITESEHIFIGAGLHAASANPRSVLEVGFGTGLNAALAAYFSINSSLSITYHSIELYPLAPDDYEKLNYATTLPEPAAVAWRKIVDSPWGQEVEIAPTFKLTKIQTDFTRWTPSEQYHVVFFDAFAPNDQPEMWTNERFGMLHQAMHPNAVLTTYCAKGVVKNALRSAGFVLERLQGPPGKRHILRATKNI